MKISTILLACLVSVYVSDVQAVVECSTDAEGEFRLGQKADRDGRIEEAVKFYRNAAKHCNRFTYWVAVGDILREDSVSSGIYSTEKEQQQAAADAYLSAYKVAGDRFEAARAAKGMVEIGIRANESAMAAVWLSHLRNIGVPDPDLETLQERIDAANRKTTAQLRGSTEADPILSGTVSFINNDKWVASTPQELAEAEGQAFGEAPRPPPMNPWWPPPPPSGRMTIPRSLLFRTPPENAFLLMVGGSLEEALNRRDYEHSYYEIPGGFVLVARLERVDEQGKPLPEDFRFLPPNDDPTMSFSDFFKALFFAPVGHYRMIAFMVSDKTPPVGSTGITPDQAVELLKGGSAHLDAKYAQLPFTSNHQVDALIYEFRKREADRDVSQLTPGQFSAQTNLKRAGLYAALTAVARQ